MKKRIALGLALVAAIAVAPLAVWAATYNEDVTINGNLELNGDFGMNTATPAYGFTLVNSGSSGITCAFQNADTGTGTAKGFQFGINAYEEPIFFNFQKKPMYFGTDSMYRMTILGNGKVGIGTLNPTTRLDVNGEASANVINVKGADVSERFDVQSTEGVAIEPGTVVSINIEKPGQLMVSSKAYDRAVAGIISGANGLKPGMMMGGSMGEHPVALSGRVYCKVDATHAAVSPGDLLTTADTPGHAMKVLDHGKAAGTIIGKAMTPLAQGEKGLVLVLVTLQ